MALRPAVAVETGLWQLRMDLCVSETAPGSVRGAHCGQSLCQVSQPTAVATGDCDGDKSRAVAVAHGFVCCRK